MRAVRLSVPDMKCGGCVATVNDALVAVSGVEEVHVDLETKVAQVVAPQSVTTSDLTRVVEASGFSAAPLD